MNYAWITYEKGLHHLFQYLPQNHSEYGKVCNLQKLLQQNISQAESQGDTDTLRMGRKRIIADLESLTRQAMEDGFMSLCRATCLLFHYVDHIYRTASYARAAFGGDRIWPRQCQYIVEDFRKRPAVAEVARDLVESTRVALYHLDTRVDELTRLVEEYERALRLPNRRLGNRHDEVIRQADRLIGEVPTINNKSFHELIEWCRENLAEASSSADNVRAKISAEPEQPPQEPVQQPRQHWEEPVYEATPRNKDEPFQKEEISQSTLRETIVRVFSLGDLRSLCTDITDALRRDGVNDLINLDLLKGDELREKTESLVEFVVKRGQLSYLIEAVCRVRPLLELCKNHIPPHEEKRKKTI